jgi:hypothetical protein
MAAYLPPEWPTGVHPPSSEEFERTAVTWLLDVVPPDYRLHGVLRRHPVALATLARRHLAACVEGARQGYRTARTELGDVLPVSGVDAVLAAYRSEGRRLVTAARAADLVERALRGEEFTPQLHDSPGPRAQPGQDGPNGASGPRAQHSPPGPDDGSGPDAQHSPPVPDDGSGPDAQHSPPGPDGASGPHSEQSPSGPNGRPGAHDLRDQPSPSKMPRQPGPSRPQGQRPAGGKQQRPAGGKQQRQPAGRKQREKQPAGGKQRQG